MKFLKIKQLRIFNEVYPIDIFVDQLKSGRSFKNLKGKVFKPLAGYVKKGGNNLYRIKSTVAGPDIVIYPFGKDIPVEVEYESSYSELFFFPQGEVILEIKDGFRKNLFIKPEGEKEFKIEVVQFFPEKGMGLAVGSTQRGLLFSRSFGKKVLMSTKGVKEKLTYDLIKRIIVSEAKRLQVDEIAIVGNGFSKKVKVVDSFGLSGLIEELANAVDVPVSIMRFETFSEEEYLKIASSQEDLKAIYLRLLRNICRDYQIPCWKLIETNESRKLKNTTKTNATLGNFFSRLTVI